MTSHSFTASLWPQFAAAITMLENAIEECPDGVWGDRSKEPEFWYLVYHTLFWLDLYLSGTVNGFAPPKPFNLDELDPRGILPDRVYTKSELRSYLRHCRDKCRTILGNLTDADADRECVLPWRTFPFSELLLYNFRHVQHGVGQLNLLLRQRAGLGPPWVSRSDEPLPSD